MSVSFCLASKELVLPTYLSFSLLSSFIAGNNSHRVLLLPSPTLLCLLCLLCLWSSAASSVTIPSLTSRHSQVPDVISALALEQVPEAHLSLCVPSSLPPCNTHSSSCMLLGLVLPVGSQLQFLLRGAGTRQAQPQQWLLRADFSKVYQDSWLPH